MNDVTVPVKEYKYKRVKTGDRVGRLVLLGISGKSKNNSFMWLCLCDCGNTKEVISSSLNSGLTQSCGCLYEEFDGIRGRTHGLAGRSEYSNWSSMKARCYNAKSQYYYLYGGRGIKVCDRWVNSFGNFLEDMGDKPEGMSLDRINPDGDYTPDNCRWVDNKTQAFNKRRIDTNTSGRTGVYFHKEQKCYHVSINIDYKQTHLGSFKTFEEAVKVREQAELEEYGFIKE